MFRCIAAVSPNVRRLLTCRSEEADERSDSAPERRHVQPAHLFSLDLYALRLASRAKRGAAANASYLEYILLVASQVSVTDRSAAGLMVIRLLCRTRGRRGLVVFGRIGL
jgi:hypothetical protein